MKKGYFCFTDSQINSHIKKTAPITSVMQNTTRNIETIHEW